jgi:hypothetical protein
VASAHGQPLDRYRPDPYPYPYPNRRPSGVVCTVQRTPSGWARGGIHGWRARSQEQNNNTITQSHIHTITHPTSKVRDPSFLPLAPAAAVRHQTVNTPSSMYVLSVERDQGDREEEEGQSQALRISPTHPIPLGPAVGGRAPWRAWLEGFLGLAGEVGSR